VSATNRPPRPDEVDGRDYRFLTTPEFETLRDAGGLLEWFEVYGDLKGTPRAPIEEHLAAGDDVLVEVDVHGARAIQDALPDAHVAFVRPPSRAAQIQRLQTRDPSASAETIARRLAEADAEEAHADDFDTVVVNDDVDRAVAELEAILARRRAGDTGPRPPQPRDPPP
jgi:guanylate kinase